MPLIFPDHDASANTGFGGNALERLSERREDTAFITTQADDPGARALLFVGDQLLTEGASAVHPRATAERHGLSLADSVFLGRDADGPLFAGLIERPADAAPSADGPPGGSGPAPTLDAGAGLATHPLRPLASHGLLAEPLLGAVAQARGVLGWHQRHQFCANCGTKTHSAMAGMRRDCPNCGAHHFPRTDPVVIMLAVDGERCLLGRQKRFVSGVYSCLAGFMEPGETVEAAVRREIYEEAGVTASAVLYHASQPWPFPASLMIGCFAKAETTDINPQDAELEDVRWFDRADLLPMLERTHPTYGAPPAVAIAHHLLRAYALEGV